MEPTHRTSSINIDGKALRRGSMLLSGALMSGSEGLEPLGEAEGDNEGEGGGSMLDNMKTKGRILIAFSQLVSSVGFNLGISFPTNFASFLSVLSITGLDVFQFLPLI